jgi:hypothetical protein
MPLKHYKLCAHNPEDILMHVFLSVVVVQLVKEVFFLDSEICFTNFLLLIF